jgi:hypothetical protein
MKGLARKRVSLAWVVAVALSTGWGSAPAGAQMTADDQILYLEVKQAQVAFREATEKWQRAQRLAQGGLISTEQSDGERTRHSAALVDYQRALLKLIDNLPHLSILSATKFQDERGHKRVKLVLRNDTPLLSDTEYARALGDDEVFSDFLKIRTLDNVFVSLKDVGDIMPGQSAFVTAAQQIVIGKPYEARIASLPFGEQTTLEFELLKDVENVVVSMRKNAKVQDLPIKLEYDTQQGGVTVNSSQFSQEANLGTQATFDLMIERGSGGTQNLRLAAVGLPPAVRAEFVDPQTQARLTQINMLAGVTSQRLQLRLYMPEKADTSVTLDRAMPFHALFYDAERALVLPAKLDDAAARALGVGWVRLEVVPRGLGEITISAPSLFFEIKKGQHIEIALTARNTGTRRLDNIQFRFDLPSGWTATLTPDVLSALEVNREANVQAVVVPDKAAAVGDFELRLQTRCSTDNRPLQVEDKRIRVNVQRTASIAGTGIIVALILAVLVAVITAGIRLTRR